MKFIILSLFLFSSLALAQNNDLFMKFRAHAPHYWGWVQSSSQNHFSNDLMSFQGPVAGDLHIGNVADKSDFNEKREFTLIDLDDSGTAPYFYDFLRFVFSNQYSENTVPVETLLQSYLNGLQQKTKDLPPAIKKSLNPTEKDIQKKRDKYFKKAVSNNKFDYAKIDLISITALSPEVQKVFQADKPYFEKTLTDFQILDIGYKTKSDGGSRGMHRFWYLVKDTKNQKELIFEFKQLQSPATEKLQKQIPHSDRIQISMNTFWITADSRYSVITTTGRSYLKRPKLHYFFEPEDLSTQELSDSYEYIANWIGKKHSSKASPKYALEIQKQFKTLLAQINQATISYRIQLNAQP